MAMDFGNLDLKYVEVAILMETTNKYHPGKVQFYLQALTPSKPKTVDNTVRNTSNLGNLTNVDSNIGASEITSGSTLTLELPKEVARNYPKKWIPQGTRFLVSFIGGDLTKPVIIGRDYDGYVQQSY